ncbi:MAG: hypothetical protein KAY22_09075 [Rhizorhabdus sp.]|uniref:hypothetical protein n=1 Tax=Rhizorhabdus sp. TaxID=1968843 RepID=UPI001B53127C|nr:hypothetical protein [Rhizorhabdus sp.]MBP8232444.1 hypothetical protein [Rhizorhabdus sp.]
MDEQTQAAHKGGMSRAILSISAGLFLASAMAGCSGGSDKLPPGTTRVECRPVGGAPLEAACTIERMKSEDGTVLVVRSPDGGFRRLLLVRDGRGVVAADGAEPVVVGPAGPSHISVTVGGMQYRLPARVVP